MSWASLDLANFIPGGFALFVREHAREVVTERTLRGRKPVSMERRWNRLSEDARRVFCERSRYILTGFPRGYQRPFPGPVIDSGHVTELIVGDHPSVTGAST
jgi:hypothetical protein